MSVGRDRRVRCGLNGVTELEQLDKETFRMLFVSIFGDEGKKGMTIPSNTDDEKLSNLELIIEAIEDVVDMELTQLDA